MTDFSNLGSGRFWFTVITAGVFGYCAVTKILNGEQIVSIVMLVVTFYFSKNRADEKGGTQK